MRIMNHPFEDETRRHKGTKLTMIKNKTKKLTTTSGNQTSNQILNGNNTGMGYQANNRARKDSNVKQETLKILTRPPKVNQSTSDSVLEVCRGESLQGLSEKRTSGVRIKKAGTTLSDTRQSTTNDRANPKKSGQRESVQKKISTNSIRLIQQFPHTFCSSEEHPVKKSNSTTTNSVPITSQQQQLAKETKSSVEFVVPFSTSSSVGILSGGNNDPSIVVTQSSAKDKVECEGVDHNHNHVRLNCGGVGGFPQLSTSSTELGPSSSSSVPSKVKASKSDMLIADMKKPLTLMEQKKLQWAREREELNGLWSPWGRPAEGNTVPLVISSSYVNKFQTSTLQSECHLPPITNIMSPSSRGQQSKTTLWDATLKSTIPICINATTGEVHYNNNNNNNNSTQSLHQPQDTFQVNNAILISNNSINNTLTTSRTNTTTKYDEIIHGKSVDGKRTSKFSQQSANSIKSTTTNHGHHHNGWSSFDEEAFTSGYQSEATGFLSNGEEYGYNSRNGSGDGPRVGTVMSNHKKGNSVKSTKDKEKEGTVFESGVKEVKKRQTEQTIFVHNICVEGSRNSLSSQVSIPHSKSHQNLKNIPDSNGKRVPGNPPPAAMRSSISVGVGLDSSLADYNEIQKMEKEKWLLELEKQREEQRIRKQMEKEEKRPKWGDKGIGVGHFWEPSTPEDRLPQPSSRDDISVGPSTGAPAWLEKGLSRMQSSVSQPSLINAGGNEGSSSYEFQGPLNQSSVDLSRVAGLEDVEDTGSNHERSFVRGQNALVDPYMVAEKEKKRQAALEHQEAIRKQMEERQLRLKQEKEKRLQEEMVDEEKMRMQRLRELEQLELEARKMGYYHVADDEDITYQFHDLVDVEDVRKILHPNSERLPLHNDGQGEMSKSGMRREGSARSGRRLSLDDGISEPMIQSTQCTNTKVTNASLTSSQSMVNIPQSRQGSCKSDPDPDIPVMTSSIQTPNNKLQENYNDDSKGPVVNDRPVSSSLQRSRSLSHHREFGTQTDVETLTHEKKNMLKHRSHNCLAKGGHKSKASTGEETETMQKKNEKPRWGATPNKKQYIKQSEKDPLYQQRLKRRMDRIKRIEERLGGVNGGGGGDGHEHGGVSINNGDTGTESENSNGRSRHRGRSPPPRFRNRHANNFNLNHGGPPEDGVSPRRGPLKATARIQVKSQGGGGNSLSQKQNLGGGGDSSRTSRFDQTEEKPKSRKIFPDIPGRTIGPLKPTLNGDYDPFGFIRQGSSSNSSRFSSPSLESLSSKNVEHHYFKKSEGVGMEVDMEESRIISSSHSVEIRYEKDGGRKSGELLSMSPTHMSKGKKTVFSSETSDEITYRKTIIGPSSVKLNTTTDNSNVNTTNPKQHGPSKFNHHPPSKSQKHGPPTSTTQQQHPSEQGGKHKKQSSYKYDDYDMSLSNADYTKDYVKKSVSNTTSKCKQNLNQNRSEIHTPIIQSNVQNVIQNPILNRLGSPPVPALLKKLQAGIPLEDEYFDIKDIAVCDDLLYEIPRAHTAGSTSENGYKSDSSHTNVTTKHPPVVSRISSSGGLEIDIDPNYELSSIQIGTAGSPENTNTEDTEDTEEKDDDQFEEDEDEEKLVKQKIDHQSQDKRESRGESKRETEQKHHRHRHRDVKDQNEDCEDYEEDELGTFSSDHSTPRRHDQFSDHDHPIYPYPIPDSVETRSRLSPDPLIIHNHSGRSERSINSGLRRKPKVSPHTTTLEVLADYRSFNLPDYNYDTVRLIPHVDVGGLDVTAAVHNVHRPGTHDTDLSQREKLISYVINNQDVQAQISARDPELSEKGIIEFNVRLPSQSDDQEGDYDYYKDPLQTDFQDRQRATLQWLYSSDSGSKSNDSLLTHLSYLKKGIQQQQQEWNVIPSDTGDDSISHHNYSSNDMSSDDSKYST